MSYLPDNIDPTLAKSEFAEALLRRPREPFEAARAVFPTNMQAALFVLQYWLHDEWVTLEKTRLLDEHGADAFLPTAYELAHEVWYTASKATNVKEKTDAFKLYADIRGFISKPNVVNNNNNGSTEITQNVLMIKDIDRAEFASRQRALMLEAAQDAE